MVRSQKHTGPLYSEAQATTWLSWLAKNMQRENQTVFLLEGLQPYWLESTMKERAYRMLSWGIVGLNVTLTCWLTFGLISWLINCLKDGRSDGLIDGLIVGSVVGLIAGLIVGLVVGLIVGLINVRSKGLIYGLIVVLSVGLIANLIEGLISGLSVGLIFGLIAGLIYELGDRIVVGETLNLTKLPAYEFDQIHTVESMKWSWNAVYQRLPKTLILGLVFGLSVGVINGLIYGLIHGLTYGLIYGLIVGLISLAISGFKASLIQLKTHANEGISLSLRNAALFGGLAILVIGLISGLIYGLIPGLVSGLVVGVVFGLIFGQTVFFAFGGLAVIRHYTLRFLLWYHGYAPWRYARFLDYCAEELNFLQKVGGGYMFIHRYLLEYFASLEDGSHTAPSRATTPVKAQKE